MVINLMFKFLKINNDSMRATLLMISVLLLSCSSMQNNISNSCYEDFVLNGFSEATAADYINLYLHDNGIPKGIHYGIDDEKLVDIEGYTNGVVSQIVRLDTNGKIESISTGVDKNGIAVQEISINNLGNVFYVADNDCQKDSVKNGIVYHVDDSLRLNKLIKYEKGFVTNLTNLDGRGRLTDVIFEYGNVDTMLIDPNNNTARLFTKKIMRVTFHPTGHCKSCLIGYTTESDGIESAYIPPQKVDLYCEDGFPLYDSDIDFLEAILPGKLEKNAIRMNDIQRSDYVVKMLAVADSSFLKIDDFVVFLNYLQGKCTEEYFEGIGYYLTNIYLNNSDKITRLEEYIAMMPAESQRNITKTLCRILLYEYTIENSFNETIKTRGLYKKLPILKKYRALTEEIAKENEIRLVNE